MPILRFLRFSWHFLRILRYLFSPRDSSWKEQDPNTFPTHNTDQISLYFSLMKKYLPVSPVNWTFSMALTTWCSFPNIFLYAIIFMLYVLYAFNMFLSQILLFYKEIYLQCKALASKTIVSILSFKNIFYTLRSLIIILLCNFIKTIELIAYGENWTIA